MFFFFSYGILLAQELTKKVLERGYTPFVVIRPENDASRNLYTKLGFEKAFSTVRVTLMPNHKQNGNDGNEIQNDEGIEDMRVEIPETEELNQNIVAKDEGIVDGE